MSFSAIAWCCRGEIVLDRRSGKTADRVHPGVPANVFDQSHRSLAVGADYSINDVLLLQLTTTLRRRRRLYRDLYAGRPVFRCRGRGARSDLRPSTYVEKVPVHALLLDVGASWALGEHASLNFMFRRELTLAASGDLYSRSIPTINYQYRFD